VKDLFAKWMPGLAGPAMATEKQPPLFEINR